MPYEDWIVKLEYVIYKVNQNLGNETIENNPTLDKAIFITNLNLDLEENQYFSRAKRNK